MWETQEFDGHIQWFCEGTELSRPTINKLFKKFIKNGWIIESRKVGGLHFYKLNTDNKLVIQMLSLLSTYINDYLQKMIKAEEKKVEKKLTGK